MATVTGIVFAGLWIIVILLGYAMILLDSDSEEGFERYLEVAMMAALHTLICVLLPGWIVFAL